MAINYSLWPQALGGSNLKYNAKKLLSREVRHASLASTSLSRIEKIVACRELTTTLHQLKGPQPARGVVETAIRFVSGRDRDVLFVSASGYDKAVMCNKTGEPQEFFANTVLAFFSRAQNVCERAFMQPG